jgi:hypothetical protein
MQVLRFANLLFTLLSKTFRSLASVTVEPVDGMIHGLDWLGDAEGQVCRLG